MSSFQLRSIVVGLIAGLLVVAAGPAQAAIYYWDDNAATAGFGTAGASTGIWAAPTAGTVAGWSLSATGVDAFAAFTTATTDTLNFGNGATGLAAGTITVSGTVDAGDMTFASGSGAILLSGGTINLAAAQTVTVNNTTDTIGSILAGAATSFTKAGAGTLILSGANSYTGTTIIKAGTLQVGDGTAGSLNGTALTFSGTGTINFNEAAGSTQGMGLLTLTAGEATVQSTWAGSLTNSLTFTNVTARSAGASANFVQSLGTNGTDNSIILTQYNGANTVAGAFIDKGVFFNGSAYAVADSVSGYLRALAYDGNNNTAVTDTITASKHVQLTTSPASRVGDTLLSLNLSGGGVNYTMSSGTLTVPGILKSGGGAVSVISGGTAVTAGASTELVIRTDTSSDLLRIDTPITGTLSRLTKSGAGTVILTNTNTYTGATAIGAGTLQLGAGGATGTLSSSSTIVNNGSLVINNTATQTLGAISGTGSVTVTGANVTFNNTASNNFTGGVTINSGTINLANGTNLGFGATNGSTTGVVTVNGGFAFGVSGNPVIPNPFVFNTNGNVSFNANQTVTFNGPITLAQTLNTVRSGVINYGLTFNGNIDGNGGITWSNVNDNTPNVQTFTGQNTFTGSLAPSNGFLDISGSGYLGGGSYSAAVTGSGTVLRYSSSASQTLAGVLTLEALTKNTNPSTLTLSGGSANAISGLTTVSAGTLELDKSGAVNAIVNGGLTIGGANNTAATVRYTGASSNMMGTGTVTINGRGILDFNGKTDTIGNVAIVSTGATDSNPTPIINSAGGGNLTIGTLGITPVAGFTSVISAGTGGTITLGGDVTFTAATTGQAQITGTTLALGAANRIFTVGLGSGAGHDLLIDAGISDARSLTKAGIGRLILTGSNSYTLGTTVNVGTLQLGDGTTAGTMASTGALTMGGGAFRVLGPASGGSSQTVGSLVTTAATGSTIRLTPGASGNTTLTITSNTLSTGAGSTVSFDYSAGTTVGGTLGNNYVAWNPTLTGGIIGGAYTVTDSGGTGFATTSGGNVVRLTDSGTAGLPVSGGSATGSYFVGSGYSTVSTTTPGSLVEALSGAVDASNVTVDTTGLASGANLALGTNLLTLGAGMAFSGANPYEITGSGAGGLKAASAGGTIYLNNNNTSTVTINTPIVNTTASTLTVNGTGTTILGGTNTYTGATILNGGTTRFSGTMGASAVTINNNAVAQIGAATGLTSSNTVTFGPATTGSLQLLGNSVTIGALNNNATLGTPVITNNNGGPGVANATLTINSASASSFGGVIQDGTGGGTLALAKSGGGGLTLSNASNTYSGGTILNGGTLSFGTNSDVYLGATSGGLTFNGGQIAYSDDFALNVGRTVTVTTNFALTNRIVVNGVLAGNGSITQSGSDGANFANTGNTFTGPITVAYSMTFASLGDSSNPINLGAIAGWSWSGGAKTFALRPFTSDDPGNMPITNDGSGALVIQQPLAFSGGNGARTLTLGGSYTGSGNQFAGNIANGPGAPGASVVSLTINSTNPWALSGTNTYTGPTTSANNVAGLLIFQGIQALSPFTSLNGSANPSNGGGVGKYPGIFKILDDNGGTSSGTISRSGVNVNLATGNGQDPMTIFVGNNSATNGGNGAGGVTGNTIQLGDMTFSQYTTATAGGRLDVTGANGYRLQLANVKITLGGTGVPGSGAWNTMLNPTTAPLTVTGNVQQTAGGVGSVTTNLQLDGTATGNLISGNILNSADVSPRALSVSKANSSTWTLSGTNAYTGPTAITGGTLVARNASALGTGASANVTVATQTALVYNAATDVQLGIGGTLGVTGGTTTRIGTSIGTTATSAEINVTGAATISNAAHKVDIYGLNNSAHFIGLTTLIHGGASSSLNPATAPTLGTVYNNTDFTVGAFTRSATDLQITTVPATALTSGYWTGGLAGATNVWAASNGTSASNWLDSTGAASAVVPGSGTDVIISSLNLGTPITPVLAPTATVLGSDMSIKSLTISDNTNNFALNADGYGLTITPASSTVGITKNNSTTKTATIAANLVLGAGQTWSNSDTGNALVISGIVTGANNLIVTGAGNTTVSGRLLTGAGTLTKNGAGTLTLSNGNTYTGVTTVSQGTLQFAKQISLYNNTPASWTAAKINVASNATLALNVDSAGTAGFTAANLDTLLTNISVANTAAEGLQAGAKLGFDTSTATSATFTQGNAITDSTGSSTFHGAIGVTKLGAGTLVFDETNTYTGATYVTAGTLELANLAGSALTATAAVQNNSILRVSTAGQNVGAISGTGTTVIDTSINPGASLTADSIVQNTLTIGAGGSVTIRETTGGAGASPVPEPGTWVLIGIGLLSLLAFRRRR